VGTISFTGQASAGSEIFNTFAGVGRGQVLFRESASAANSTIINNGSPLAFVNGGRTAFDGSATAGNATITNEGGSGVNSFPARTDFYFDATASNATIVNEGGAADQASGGTTDFVFGANGGNATLINNGATAAGGYGGTTEFNLDSNAGNSTLIANGSSFPGTTGGVISFQSNSEGGTARVILSGNGTLDITNHDANEPTVTIGSLEGKGHVDISFRHLIVGSNNLSTVFSGRIYSAVLQGTISKIGNGTWVLTGNNKYGLGTFINDGTLVANNPTGSATGTGPVQVNRGALAGRGTVAGTVRVGSGSGRAAGVWPGDQTGRNVGVLTILGALIFNSDGNYNFQVDSDAGTADSITAAGVTIDNAALFNVRDLGNSVLSVGASFVVLNNTAATSIAGVFANLPDGSTVIIGPNEFQASYSGGDGNDLTLTVVP
jgi:autotransporter-associated beta strand protein